MFKVGDKIRFEKSLRPGMTYRIITSITTTDIEYAICSTQGKPMFISFYISLKNQHEIQKFSKLEEILYI